MQTTAGESPKRKPVNLTIREDILQAAHELNLNASDAAESGIAHAVREARTQAWLREHRGALDAHNERVEALGSFLIPRWSR